MNDTRLHALLTALQRAGLELDVESALDALWLAMQTGDRGAAEMKVTRETATAEELKRTAERAAQAGDAAELSEDKPREGSGAGSGRIGSTRARAAESSSSASAGARGVTLARAAALPGSRDLIRSLRPLRRRAISPGEGVLDVDTTVRRAAEELVWIPAFEPARERWLDVMLVADHGLSMMLWKDTIDEFERVLRNAGAFRSVQSWWMESDAESPTVTARGNGQSPSTPPRLTRLVRGEGRSVILVISDCVGPRWHDGAIPRLIDGWSQSVPVALVQVTPEWFWARTALGDTVSSRMRGAIPAAVNKRMRWDAAQVGVLAEGEDALFLRLPAITLTANSVAQMAGLIAGVGRSWTPGVVFDLTWTSEEVKGKTTTANAEERMARFRALASPAALRLASAFAASPVRTLGVLRLLRRDLLNETSPFVEAEVLLGGVLRVRREDASWEMGGGLPLEFVPGVQAMLLDGALMGDVLHVLEVAAAEAKEGVVPTFTSWLREPSSGSGQLDPSESAFAAAAAAALERLGGAHAQVVKRAPPSARDASEVRTEASSEERFEAGPTWVGGPHQLPLSGELLGRSEERAQLTQWLRSDMVTRAKVIQGGPGIGKSALAADAVLQWRNASTGHEAFVWSFHQDPSVEAALSALIRYLLGDEAATRVSGQEVFPMLQQLLREDRRPRLIVLDAFDARRAESQWTRAEIAAFLALLERLESGVGLHLLVTSRTELTAIELIRDMDTITSDHFESLLSSANQFLAASADRIELSALDSPSMERLLQRQFDARVTAGVPPRSRDTVGAMLNVLRRAGGNLKFSDSLIDALMELTSEEMTEELGLRGSADDSELSIEWMTQTLDRVRRARGFARAAAADEQAGDMEKALAAFDEEVRLRGSLPSRLYRARALVNRGRLAAQRADYDRAGADLADAAGLYRSLEAKTPLAIALGALAEVRVATGRLEEAVSALTEASEVSRQIDPNTLARFEYQLATVLLDLRRLDEAIQHAAVAEETAARDHDFAMMSFAAVLQSRVLVERGSKAEARRCAKRALEHASKADDTAVLERVNEMLSAFLSKPSVASDSIAVPSPDDDRTVSAVYEISGRVQGVGFRTFVREAAIELGISGSALILPDGRIRVEAKGAAARISELEKRLRVGPAGAQVEQVLRVEDDSVPGEIHSQTVEQRGIRPWRDDGRDRAVVAIGVGRIHEFPELPAANDVARRVGEWARSQGIQNVFVFTDEIKPVTSMSVSDVVRSLVELRTLTQIIVYFAGYAVNLHREERLLLTGAPNNPSEAIDVAAMAAMARASGIDHVVFITDTLRIPAEIGDAMHVNGVSLFPAASLERASVVVDSFTSEDREVGKNMRRFSGDYTRLMLAALDGKGDLRLDFREGGAYVTARALHRYLRDAMDRLQNESGASISEFRAPDARIESSDDQFVARVDTHLPPPFASSYQSSPSPVPA